MILSRTGVPGSTLQAEPAREEFQGNGAAAGADALTAGKSAEPAPGGEGGERQDREAWRGAVHGVAKSETRLSD